MPVGQLVYPVVDLLHLAGAGGTICYGPYRENEPTFVRAEAWIPNWQDVPVEQAEDQLFRDYLQVYGPASTADFAVWSGFTQTQAGAIRARLQTEIAPVDLQGVDGWVLREDLDALTRVSSEPAPVRLLPYFDTYLLGHRKRQHLVAQEHNPQVYRPQGWIAPVLLVDGRVAGVWAYTQVGKTLKVAVNPFEAVSRRVMTAIRAEAQDLGRFLGAEEVQVRV